MGKNIGDAIEYTLLDIDTRLVNGTAESRGEILGEALFEICLDVAIGKAVTKFANVKGATAVDDLDNIKSSHVTSNAGNATNHYWIDTIDDVEIWIQSTNLEAYTKLALQYGDDFRQLVAKYSTRADDLTVLLNSCNSNAANNIINLTVEYGSEALDDLWYAYQHGNVDGVYMLLDNLSVLPDNMDGVWKLSSLERGLYLENYFAATDYKFWYHIGAENDGFFPIIDFQDGNKVISMKTLDPRLKSYQNESYLRTTIEGYFKTLHDSPITVNDVLAEKELLIVIPTGTTSNRLETILQELSRNNGISYTIKEAF